MEYIINLTLDDDVVEKNILRLINQLWKLIPMREKEEDWKKQLNTVIIEIAGLGSIFNKDPHFLQLLMKLKGLEEVETDFGLYRKTVFESIGLLRGCVKNDK